MSLVLKHHARCEREASGKCAPFAGRFDFDNGKPRANFDNFWTAFLSMFQVASQQNWPYVMFDSMRVAGKVTGCSRSATANLPLPSLLALNF